MIQKINKNNDKKLDNLMIMMQKFPLDLELKWIRNDFCNLNEQMGYSCEIKWNNMD